MTIYYISFQGVSELKALLVCRCLRIECKAHSDTYLKKENGIYKDSEFFLEIAQIRVRKFKHGTKSPERINSNPLLARR